MDITNFALFKVIHFRLNVFKDTVAQVGEEISVRRLLCLFI